MNTCLVLACLGILCGATPEVAASPEILIPGEYHGNEVHAVSGKGWLGLFGPDAGGTAVAQVELHVDTVLDALLDENGPPTGKRVGSSVGPAVLLMKDVPHVEPGPVRMIAADVLLVPNEPVSLALDAPNPVFLELACVAPKSSRGTQQSTCKLVLRAGAEGKAQVLRKYEAYYNDGTFGGVGNDAPVRVIWAGDLDGDTRLDLLLDLTDHYNVARPTLFLSTAAEGDSLVAAVAEHQSTGC